jgi:hypothetical protein
MCLRPTESRLILQWSPRLSGRRVGLGQQGSTAEATEPGRAVSVVRVEKIACLLMRESGFFMAALSTGFKEAKDMALDSHADSEQGEGPRPYGSIYGRPRGEAHEPLPR